MKILFLSIMLFLIPSYTYSQYNKILLSPAGYYSSGNYSNGNYSNEFSVYSSVYKDYYESIIAGYDNLLIKNYNWNYTQHSFLIGGLKNLYPFYIKLNYQYTEGKYNYKPSVFNYTDITNLINVHTFYNAGRTYLGIAYTFLHLNGFKKLTSNQFNLTFDFIISPRVVLSVYPDYSLLTDGRKLSSVEAHVTYIPAQWLKMICGGFVGQRAYFFNPVYLTLSNQDETQIGSFDIRTELSFIKPLNFIAGYQFLKFENYNIKFITAGLRINLGF